MKKLFFLLFSAVSLSASAQQAKYVVLITIDGFRPDFYLEDGWGTPNLKKMKDNGVAANGVYGVFPTVTYPNHTSIITGTTPAKHGVYYNAPFEPTGASGKWYWDYKSINVPTLYNAIHAAGKTSANVIWPVTVNAPIDYNVPDIWPIGKGNDRLDATASVTRPASLWKEIQENATGKLTPDDFSMVREEMIMDENVARMGAYMITKYKPTFTTLHLACADHYEHMEGRDGYLVRKAVTGADRALGTILDALVRAGIQDSTAVIVTGDHGFVDIKTAFAPNVLLAKAGLMNDIKKGDWKAQFHSAGGSAFLHLKDPKDAATLKAVEQLLSKLPADQRKLFKVISRNQLGEVGADPNAVLALAATPGTTISGSAKGEVVKTAKGGTHGFYPDFKEIQTGFVAYGAGIVKGGTVKEMQLIDVAPIVAKLLSLDFKTAEGHIPDGILK